MRVDRERIIVVILSADRQVVRPVAVVPPVVAPIIPLPQPEHTAGLAELWPACRCREAGGGDGNLRRLRRPARCACYARPYYRRAGGRR